MADEPKAGDEYVVRYRVLGRSSVWDGFYVVETLDGPEAGKKRVLPLREFVGPTLDGVMDRPVLTRMEAPRG